MLDWLQLRFGTLPLRIHHVAFHPRRDDRYDVVVDFEKDHPGALGVELIQFRGWVRWLPLADQPTKFSLVANRKVQFRFGIVSRVDFEALLARLKDKGSIKIRLVLRSGGSRTMRSCMLPRNAIDHTTQTPWPPEAP